VEVPSSGYVVGVEIGGTFTDIILLGEHGIVETAKVPTTPRNPAEGALAGLLQLSVPLSALRAVVHGSTIATNSLLERKGATTALLMTEGFRDVLEIQREERDRIYDLRYQKPQPLVPRERVLPVRERVDGAGRIICPLELGGIQAAINELIEKEHVDSIAICLLNSYLYPRHEQQLAKLIRRCHPDLHISISSDVLPEFREYYRANTTVIDAFVTPKVSAYVGAMGAKMSDEGLRGEFIVMQSNGGILPAEAARTHGAWILLSGPAAGAVAAASIGTEAGYPNVISLDMGGTSADVCLVTSGVPHLTTETEIDHLPIGLPMTDIATIGAGGGSIARIDDGGMLTVGPESAGADPGPACYGRDGRDATVTDANVLRGLIRPKSFLGGRMPLLPERSRTVCAPLAQRLARDIEDAAEAVCRVVNANMAQAIRVVSVSRGHDPRDFVLVAFGGAGPLHAADLAEELELERVLVPRHPGLLSAYGLLVADFRRDYVQTRVSPAAQTTSAEILDQFDRLEVRGREECGRYQSISHIAPVGMSLDMRYHGQAYELMVPVTQRDFAASDLGWLSDRFHTAHKLRYGHASPRDAVEIVNYRLSLGAPGGLTSLRETALPNGNRETKQQTTPDATGRVYHNGEWVPAAYWRREQLSSGQCCQGPCVIEEPTATTYVPAAWQAAVDHRYNLLLTRK